MTKIKINFPKLYPAQKKVVKAFLNDDYRYITLNGSRQIGKTFILAYVAIHAALSSSAQRIMIVSPTDGQVHKIYKQILELLKPVLKETVKSYKAQSGTSEIIFKTDSQILFRSAAAFQNLRGESITHLLIDEAAFIKEEVYQQVLAPMLTVRGKKVLFCSTPKGTNYFHKLYQMGMGAVDKYVSFKITWRENPFADTTFIEEQRQLLAKEIYEQEYEGAFTDAANIFKYVKELATLKHSTPTKQKCTIGIDIAFKNDYTVAMCISDKGEMLDYIRFNKVDTQEMVDKLYAFIKKWNPTKTIIEENNQGLSIYHLLKAKGLYNFDSFVTTSKSKGEIINLLISAFSAKEIKLLNDPLIISEAEAFTYSLSKNGNVQFAAAFGHDDTVMATALAWHAKKLTAIGKIVFM